MRVTATSSKSGAAASRRTTVAVQSVLVPVTSTSRCGSTPRTAAWSGRIDAGPYRLIQARSSWAGPLDTVTVSAVNDAATYAAGLSIGWRARVSTADVPRAREIRSAATPA